jgi:hypothetical protein
LLLSKVATQPGQTWVFKLNIFNPPICMNKYIEQNTNVNIRNMPRPWFKRPPRRFTLTKDSIIETLVPPLF